MSSLRRLFSVALLSGLSGLRGSGPPRHPSGAFRAPARGPRAPHRRGPSSVCEPRGAPGVGAPPDRAFRSARSGVRIRPPAGAHRIQKRGRRRRAAAVVGELQHLGAQRGGIAGEQGLGMGLVVPVTCPPNTRGARCMS